MLIVEDQLKQVRQQVRLSEEPIIVADAQGEIIFTNESFQLLPHADETPQNIKDLAPLFSAPGEVTERLAELIKRCRSWRGEVELAVEGNGTKTLMVRADPVFSSPERVLGFVLLFTDLTERKAAEAARRRLQEGIFEGHEIRSVRLGAGRDAQYLKLLSSLIGNAQRAALEITDSVDVARVPAMLDSVRASVTRAAELLEKLIWHARHGSKRD